MKLARGPQGPTGPTGPTGVSFPVGDTSAFLTHVAATVIGTMLGLAIGVAAVVWIAAGGW